MANVLVWLIWIASVIVGVAVVVFLAKVLDARSWCARWFHSGSVPKRTIAGPVKVFAEVWPAAVNALVIVGLAAGSLYWFVFPVEGYWEDPVVFGKGALGTWFTIAVALLVDDWCFWTSEIVEPKDGAETA
jgi:hypothetical protein